MTLHSTLQEIVEAFEGKLTEADRRLLNAILANPTDSAFLAGSALAERVGVHPAATVRLAKKLGFEGYPQLRELLQAQISNGSTPDARMRRRLEHLESDSVLGSLVETEIAALRQMVASVPQERLESAARMLVDAGTIYLYGRGSSTPLVNLLDRRLRRSGRRVITVSGLQKREAAERFLPLHQNDVVFAFAFRSKKSAPAALSAAFEYAQAVGAKTILVSDSYGTNVRPRPDVLLHASRGDDVEFVTMTVPMLICDAIALTMMRLDDGHSLESLRALSALRKSFEQQG